LAAGRAAAAVGAVDRPLIAGVLVALLGAGGVLVHRSGHYLSLLEPMERRALDQRFLSRGPTPASDEIVLLGIDEETLRRDARLFERRAGYARVIDAVAAAHPRAIGVDSLFTEAEEMLPRPLHEDIERWLQAKPAGRRDDADRLLARVDDETHGDTELARAIGQAGNVVLGLHLGHARQGQVATAASLPRGKYGQVLPGPYQPHEIREVRASLPMLNAKARALGYLSMDEDAWHSMRGVPLARSYQESVFAPLSVHLVALARGLGRAGIAYLGNDHVVQIGDDRFPLDDDDGILLNLRGPAGTYPVYSVVDVVEGKVPLERLRDKIVVIGPTYLGTDLTRTSFGAGVPGIEIHANAIDNLLRKDPLIRAGMFTDALVTFALGLLVAILFWPRLGLPLSAQVVAALVAAGAFVWIGQRVFEVRHLWLSTAGPLITVAGVATVALGLGYAREGIERRRVRRAFSHYLSDGLIDELLRDPSALALGGARRRLSVLFSDIRGFTTLSEGLDPERLVRLLNDYLTPMTGAVLREGGLVDKFIGDAVMAFFGAPVPHEDHASRALRAAVGMHEALEAMRPAFERLGVVIEIGVGVNTGEMAVGNMGSADRFNYTVMGDAVNLGSRLEGLTKAYGVFCLVGQDTRDAIRDGEFQFRELDLVQVKGKHEPTRIYELLSGRGRELARYHGAERFDEGVAAFRAGKLTDARTAFDAFLNLNPADAATRQYLARLAELGDGVPDGWRGVRVFDSK
jgi:adenylate cyclase